jgi:broad specificity phosphatase PhoE
MSSPTRFFFVRHGEVESAYHRVFGGTIDMELSPFGHEQAHSMAEYLQRYPFDAIYASPMKRVQQTLAALVELQNKVATVLPGLREVDFGDWTGLSWEQVSEQFQVSALTWLEQLAHGRIKRAESVGHFRERVDLALTDSAGAIGEECGDRVPRRGHSNGSGPCTRSPIQENGWIRH